MIDLIFERNTDNVSSHGTLPKIADHDGVLVSYLINSQKQKQKTKIIHDYKNADINGLIDHIKNFDFDTAVFQYPVVKQVEIYCKFLIDTFSQFIPCKVVQIRVNDQPWSNSYTRLLIRKKNRNYQLYKKIDNIYNSLLSQQNASPDILTKYLNKKNKAYSKAKNASNESTKANRRVKFAFYNSVNSTLNNSSISAKKKFQILLKLMKNNKFSPTPPLAENNQSINEPKERSEIFNTFFASKSTVKDAFEEPPILQRFQTIEMINTSPISISGKFLSLISQQISYSLSTLFNNHFEIGYFPDTWKIAHVTPVYKRNGPKNDKNNFRPISILPTLSKVCESVIHERLLTHCIENDVISHRQAAYLKGDSTMSQLLYIQHQIRLSWGKSHITQAAFLDISAAFDKVWHNGLLAKLG